MTGLKSSVPNLLYSQCVQTREISEGSISDEADLVVANRELLELAQTHKAAFLQAYQLIRAEVSKIHRNRTNQSKSYNYQDNTVLDMKQVPGYIPILETCHKHTTWWKFRYRCLQCIRVHKILHRIWRSMLFYYIVLHVLLKQLIWASSL